MPTVTIHKENGKLQTSGADILRGIESALAHRGNGDYRLLLEKVTKRRTVNQNRLSWMWFNCIGQETGNTAQDIHDIYCALFLRKSAYFAGASVETVKGTSGLTTAEFTAFLDRVKAHAAAELGIILPTPEDEGFDDFASIYDKTI